VHLNMTSKSLGDTYVNLWFKRNVGDFRYRNFKSDVNETIHRDNFGTFVFKDNTFSGYNFRINTDYSKPFAIKFMYRNHVFRQSDWIGYYGNLQIRPNNKLRFELIGKFTDLKGSALMSRAFYRSLALKSQISFSDQVHLKSYNQFNSQSRSLSNNFVLSYEFLRGNFLYVAYTEIGEIDKEYTEGSLINDYRLKNRTLSMKCSYTLNLYFIVSLLEENQIGESVMFFAFLMFRLEHVSIFPMNIESIDAVIIKGNYLNRDRSDKF